MEEKIVYVDCDVCDCERREISRDNLKIVHNLTWDTYTYTYFCVMCGTRQVHELDGAWVTTMISEGWNYTAFTMPFLSYRPGGPTINNDDVNKFVESLNAHDHLAAYA
jgi:hypothetical protein